MEINIQGHTEIIFPSMEQKIQTGRNPLGKGKTIGKLTQKI